MITGASKFVMFGSCGSLDREATKGKFIIPTESRRGEGCLAVEMELAGVQAVCSFYGLALYNFLEAGGVLEESGYDVANLRGANHDLGKLYIALEAALHI
mgnify:FL=1